MDKAHDYQNLIGRTHLAKEELRERWSKWKEEHPLGLAGTIKEVIGSQFKNPDQETLPGCAEYSHIYR